MVNSPAMACPKSFQVLEPEWLLELEAMETEDRDTWKSAGQI